MAGAREPDRPDRRPRARGLGVALVCVVLQLGVALAAVATPDGLALETLLFVVAPVAVLTTVLLWTTVVASGGTRAGLACALLALATVPFYRVGVTIPLAGAALVVGRGAPVADSAHPRRGCATLVLAVLALAVVAYLVAVDAVDLLFAEAAAGARASTSDAHASADPAAHLLLSRPRVAG